MLKVMGPRYPLSYVFASEKSALYDRYCDKADKGLEFVGKPG